MPDAVLLVEADTGSIVDCNEKAHQNLGYTREEFRQLRLCDIDHLESERDVS